MKVTRTRDGVTTTVCRHDWSFKGLKATCSDCGLVIELPSYLTDIKDNTILRHEAGHKAALLAGLKRAKQERADAKAYRQLRASGKIEA